MRDGLLLALIVATAMVMSAVAVKADVPQLINYQGLLLDASGQPVTTPVSVDFSIYDVPSGGSPVWAETRTVQPDASGMFSINLGESNPIVQGVFAGPERWLGIRIPPDPEMIPRTRFTSVAYSYRVATVDGATGGVISGDVAIQSNLDVNGDILVTGKATIGPGHTNTGNYAFVAGANNTSSGIGSTVGGGTANTASGELAIVGGGMMNMTSGPWCTVGGGRSNTAGGYYYATVGGGRYNTASGDGATVGGGGWSTASGNLSTVGGGLFNEASGQVSTVGGGNENTTNVVFGGVFSGYSNLAGDDEADTAAFVGGGYDNSATAKFATVGGGNANTASAVWGTVGGGYQNTASTANFTTVSGGRLNIASGTESTVSGGWENAASGTGSTVGGGHGNTASGYTNTVAGGGVNTASGTWRSTVGGGYSNTASADFSTVAGGGGNIASGAFSTIPGGNHNTASGNYSFAAGRRAKANHNGAFVWADQTDADFASTGADQFLIRASAGVGIGTTNPQEALDVNGTVQMQGFKMPSGAAQGYVLTALASGEGTWQPANGFNPQDSFRRFTSCSGDAVVLPASADVRYITGIWVAPTLVFQTGPQFYIAGGANVVSLGTTTGGAFWSSGGGAPIVIQNGEVLRVTNILSVVHITITGYVL